MAINTATAKQLQQHPAAQQLLAASQASASEAPTQISPTAAMPADSAAPPGVTAPTAAANGHDAAAGGPSAAHSPAAAAGDPGTSGPLGLGPAGPGPQGPEEVFLGLRGEAAAWLRALCEQHAATNARMLRRALSRQVPAAALAPSAAGGVGAADVGGGAGGSMR
jgi:hypothetical protein